MIDFLGAPASAVSDDGVLSTHSSRTTGRRCTSLAWFRDLDMHGLLERTSSLPLDWRHRPMGAPRPSAVLPSTDDNTLGARHVTEAEELELILDTGPMNDFKLRTLDAAGEAIRLDIWLQPGAVEFRSGARSLGTIGRDDLLRWLDHPRGQLSDQDLSLRSIAGEVVLEIGILFVSQVVVRQELESLRAYISLEIDALGRDEL
jgi:hypothetical protein